MQFTYKCPDCGRRKTESYVMGSSPHAIDCQCGGTAKKHIAPRTSFYINKNHLDHSLTYTGPRKF